MPLARSQSERFPTSSTRSPDTKSDRSLPSAKSARNLGALPSISPAQQIGGDAGVDMETGRDLGIRQLVEPQTLLDGAVEKIRAAFVNLGWSPNGVTPELFQELQFQLSEVIGLRLYTGPMFIVSSLAST